MDYDHPFDADQSLSDADKHGVKPRAIISKCFSWADCNDSLECPTPLLF
jgi:hypothetical protein